MSDMPVDPDETLNDADQSIVDPGHAEDARASIVFALMQFNRTGQDSPHEHRNDFMEVIKHADFLTIDPGTAILPAGGTFDRLYFILEGTAVGISGDGTASVFEKGDLVGHLSLLADEPCTTACIAGDKGASLLSIKNETLISHPAVYRSLLGRGLVISAGCCDYELGKKLGEGVNGPVYEIQGHKLCAKIYRARPDAAGGAFQLIAPDIFELKHPNIVSIQEAVAAHGAQVVIMDIASGITIMRNTGEGAHCRTLREMSQVFRSEQQRMSLDMTAKIFRHVASALLYIHDQGYVHRDVKPEHIFIDVCDNDICFKLSDFSLAFPISTRPRKIVGTPDYCPPEAIDIDRPEAVISGSADFYSLAAVCFELLTDQKIFDSQNVLELAQQHLDAEPDLLRLPSDTPIWLVRFIEQALQKDPARRPLRADIENFISVA